MSTYPPPEEGHCVCGRALPEQPLSEWACSEPCQTAWMLHHANPDYPHPQQIREAANHQLALRRKDSAAPATAPGRIAEGTEIDVDGRPYVRVGSHWQPAGMWLPLTGEADNQGVYRRWCPTCRRRVPSLIYPTSDQQECALCGYQWQGRPLLGQIEYRGRPWPNIRLRLFDGHRSAVELFPPDVFDAAPPADLAHRLDQAWLRLERQLCGGYADLDQPNQQQQESQARRLARAWHMST